ncbi:MAG: Glycosyl transferase group 1 [Candidatus Uhrbacteria bacterium GW2011_GWE2_45_35]|uniref:Glycosyl transferase group 1 n=2 Tax=Candidatus Uhriibacteriota TaxID=1752732 RepID=A0A0G1JAA3_9BACT|nr:MAG: Glycosyl transferase group 1 [Candidatus Uhrbacteria bacterium GW2011_GWF2_44_350]KKU05866.1 MAG: Glycosyl transferase group 1 [Candidatus Uhrbacteria bacterium GW2011_GWE2_45_35]
MLKKYDFIVVIAGSQTDRRYLHSINKFLENKVCQKSFCFLGHVNQLEMSEVFNIADCVVTPSLYEPFGMVNLQAAFLGKTVITTNIAGSVDVLRDYDNLVVVRPCSVEDIQDSLEKILSTNRKVTAQSFDFSQYLWVNVAKEMLNYMKY